MIEQLWTRNYFNRAGTWRSVYLFKLNENSVRKYFNWYHVAKLNLLLSSFYWLSWRPSLTWNIGKITYNKVPVCPGTTRNAPCEPIHNAIQVYPRLLASAILYSYCSAFCRLLEINNNALVSFLVPNTCSKSWYVSASALFSAQPHTSGLSKSLYRLISLVVAGF